MDFQNISDEQLDQVTGGGLLSSIAGILDQSVGLVQDVANETIGLASSSVGQLGELGLTIFGNTISVFRSVLGGVFGTLRGILSFS